MSADQILQANIGNTDSLVSIPKYRTTNNSILQVHIPKKTDDISDIAIIYMYTYTERPHRYWPRTCCSQSSASILNSYAALLKTLTLCSHLSKTTCSIVF